MLSRLFDYWKIHGIYIVNVVNLYTYIHTYINTYIYIYIYIYIYNKLLIFMDVLGIFWEVTNQISRLDFSDTFTMFIFSFSFIFVKACF